MSECPSPMVDTVGSTCKRLLSNSADAKLKLSTASRRLPNCAMPAADAVKPSQVNCCDGIDGPDLARVSIGTEKPEQARLCDASAVPKVVSDIAKREASEQAMPLVGTAEPRCAWLRSSRGGPEEESSTAEHVGLGHKRLLVKGSSSMCAKLITGSAKIEPDRAVPEIVREDDSQQVPCNGGERPSVARANIGRLGPT